MRRQDQPVTTVSVAVVWFERLLSSQTTVSSNLLQPGHFN